MSETSVPPRRWILVLVLAAMAMGAGAWFGRGDPRSVNDPMPVGPVYTTSVPLTGATPPTIKVHVSGFVADPGVVTVPSNARVGDAVAAAGGAKSGARLAGINLAQQLEDGQQIVVPGPGPLVAAEPTPAQSPGDDSVHLNSATVEDLERLPGVGPVLAGRILAYRESHGPFETIEDLLEVGGIGEAKLEAIRDMATVP